MPITFKGEPVTILRHATNEDPSPKEGTEQVLIRQSDGTEIRVAKSDLKEKDEKDIGDDTMEPLIPAPKPAMAPAPVPKEAKKKRKK